MNKTSFFEYIKMKESALDGNPTSPGRPGYDTPLSPKAQQVVNMCQHYFQTLSDVEIDHIGQMIQDFLRNRAKNRN